MGGPPGGNATGRPVGPRNVEPEEFGLGTFQVMFIASICPGAYSRTFNPLWSSTLQVACQQQACRPASKLSSWIAIAPRGHDLTLVISTCAPQNATHLELAAALNHPQGATMPRSYTTDAPQAGNVDAEGARPLPVPSGKVLKAMDESADEPVMGIPDSPGAVPYAQYRNLRLMNMRGMLSAGAPLLGSWWRLRAGVVCAG